MDLSYDAMNRLITVSGSGIEARFTYDHRNRVTSRTYNGETTFLVYDDWNLIAEYDAAGQLKARYVHGPRIDEVILTVNNHGTFFHHHDALGSVTHLTDLDGSVVESYQYDIYGNATIFDGTDAFLETSAINNRFLFTGREYLPELHLYDYRNRIYSADLGHFIQTDPIRFDAGDVNIYRYVFNNPLRWIDPSGEFALNAVGAVAGAVGGFVSYTASTVVSGGEWSASGAAIAAAGGAVSGAITGGVSVVHMGANAARVSYGIWQSAGAGAASGVTTGLLEQAFE